MRGGKGHCRARSDARTVAHLLLFSEGAGKKSALGGSDKERHLSRQMQNRGKPLKHIEDPAAADRQGHPFDFELVSLSFTP